MLPSVIVAPSLTATGACFGRAQAPEEGGGASCVRTELTLRLPRSPLARRLHIVQVCGAYAGLKNAPLARAALPVRIESLEIRAKSLQRCRRVPLP